MSDVLEKTLASLPAIVGGFGVNPSKGGFQNFVKNVLAARTKYEEDQVLLREISLQKQKLIQPNLSMVQKCDSLVRLLYCHMLGKDVSFVCIHAVKLAQQGSILQKKVGYLVCSMLMSQDHELVMLLVNTMQKDLMSTNVLDNLASLTAISHLCTAEMVPAMLPLVKEKLLHERDAIRKRAVLCLHHFLHCAPQMVTHDTRILRNALSDRDPSVVWAAVNVYSELVQDSPGSYLDLVPGLLGILGQVIGRRLSTDYDYHTVPAPWLSVVILRVLRHLGAHSHSASQEIYPLLKEVLQKTEPSHKMGLAVIFECLQTIAHIAPHPQLVDHAVSSVGRFLSAKSINLKYLGLKALVSMATISPQCTLDHQDVVLDCLEHNDVTIQRQTLELLYKMANASNVQVISAKMLEFMHKSTESFIRADIITKVTELTHRFCDNLLWYIRTMNAVIQAAEDAVPSCTAQTMMRTISSGCVARGDESDPLADKTLRADVFNLYWEILQQERLPSPVSQVAVWVVGEYSHCVPSVTPSTVIMALVRIYQMNSDLATKVQVLVCLQKLSYYIVEHTEIVSHLKNHSGMNRMLVQRINEFENLCKAKQIMKISCNPEARPDMMQLDFSLSFLDGFVCEALERGALPYKTKTFRDYKPAPDTAASLPASSLSFAPYQPPVIPHRAAVGSYVPQTAVMKETLASGSSGGSSNRENREGLKLKSAQKVWGPEGLIREESPLKSMDDTSSTKMAHSMQSPETEDSTPQTVEQMKRTELASILFGSMRLNERDKNNGSQELVNLSSSSNDMNEQMLFSSNQRTLLSNDIITGTQDDEVVISSDLDKNPEISMESSKLFSAKSAPVTTTTTPVTTTTTPVTVTATPVTATATPVTTADLSPAEDLLVSNQDIHAESQHVASGETCVSTPAPPTQLTSKEWPCSEHSSLITELTLQSPEDQVITGSMYDNFTDADMEYVKVPHKNVSPENGVSKGSVSKHNSSENEKTMYDDMQISFLSGTSDDFVQTNATVGGLETDKMKDSHPSPWKMLGSRHANRIYDDSTEDSISIEVDSIEDEEPAINFKEELPKPVFNVTKMTLTLNCGALETLEPLPKSEPLILFEQSGYVLKCQKVFRTDCLVLVLHFTFEDIDQGNHSNPPTDTGTLEVGNVSSYNITLQPITESPLCDDQSIPIPGTTLVNLAPESDTYSTDPYASITLTVSLPGTGAPISFQVHVDITDFMRPSVLSVEMFGQLWSSDHLFLEKMTLQKGQGHKEKLQDMGFRVIQTIGHESILAASWLDKTNNVILAHCQPGNDGIHVSIKCQHKEIVSSLVKYLNKECKPS